MADDKAHELKGPDLKLGVDVGPWQKTHLCWVTLKVKRSFLSGKGDNIFATAQLVRITAAPFRKGSWWAKLFAARGTTRDSACAPAKPKALPHSILSRAFMSTREDGKVRVDRKRDVTFQVACPRNPDSVVIIGAGAAGAACADMLRTKGYSRPITLVGDEEPGPVDRPKSLQRFSCRHRSRRVDSAPHPRLLQIH